MADISPFYVMDILGRAQAMEAAGRSVIHMEIGEPDFPSPDVVLEAGVAALKQQKTHYTPTLGLPELRQAISDYYQQRFQVDVSPKRIIITPGSSGALQLVLGALLNPGDGVILADPGYPCNQNIIKLFGGRPKPVAVDESTDYQLTASLVKEAKNTKSKALLLASPSNPTGTVVSEVEMEKIARCSTEVGLHLIVDEIYQELVYDEMPRTVLSQLDDVFVVNSFSKYFCMTGWRLGWVVAPEHFLHVLEKIAQNIFLAAPTIAQYAALSAFEQKSILVLNKQRVILQERRDYLVAALRSLGFKVPIIPQGAFYVYVDCREFTDDSFQLAQQLLEKAGVAVTPGNDFGNNNTSHYLRFSYTCSLESLREGVKRMKEFFSQST